MQPEFKRFASFIAYKVCTNISDGGVGFNDLSISNLEFLKKMTLDIYVKNNLAMEHCRRCFLMDLRTPKNHSFGSFIWPNMRILF